jgi:hypothetical protein
MNDKKKSFLLYLDTLEILHKLTDEQAGKLLKAFLAYHSEQDLKLDPMLDLVFFSFQAQFERDGIKYNNIVERNKNNGLKGGRPKNPAKAKEPSGLSGNPSKPKEADSVSDKDSDSDKDNKDLVQAEPKRSKFKFSDVDYQCAEWAYSLVIKVAPASKKPNFENWANTIRLMRELDKLTHDDISQVFTWANQDQFWSVNILSVAKLREKFPQLQAKMKGVNNGHQSTSKKLSAYERARAANNEYRQPDEREVAMGTDGGHLGGAVDEGAGRAAIEHVDNEPFIDY